MNSNEEKYNWRYCQTGGMTRVEIISGEDIAHLDELDRKQWTVLSCPVKGLHFDKKALEIIDSDKDGFIRVTEVISAAKWLTSILVNPDELFFGKSSVAISDINPETENGARMIATANKIFDLIGKENRAEISQSDVTEALGHVKKTEDKSLPYGDDSQAAAEIVHKMNAKISDWFVRCALASFNGESTSALDVNPEKIAAISAYNLTGCMDEISALPLTHISPEGKLPLAGPINPAWQADFTALKALVLDKDFPRAKSISEEQWKAVLAKIAAFEDKKEVVAQSDAEAIAEMGNFLTLTEHFTRFLRNYVTFSDFYSRNENTLAVFQAGKLFIDQRCCELCIEVSDMDAHNASAALSGMYLLYCDCRSVKLGTTKKIVAAVTRGDVNNLRKGKNALFYDREGNEYDATVTTIIDNPISIKQAFFSPYRKLNDWITEKVNKSAAEKDASAIDSLKAKTEEKFLGKPGEKEQSKQPFDIAKFAGIFAAIGLAVGYISKALVDIAAGISSKWYNLPIFIILIVLVISGPAMFLAWSKLRKRNLSPLLNANGWAVNAANLINVSFGSTLTSEVKYPGLELVDPIAAKQFKSEKKKRTIYTILAVILIIFAILYFNNKLAFMGLPW